MVMINNLKKITAVIFLAALLGLPVNAHAQSAAPGTTDSSNSGSATTDAWDKIREERDRKAFEAASGKETGGKYGVTDAWSDATNSAYGSIADAAGETIDNIKDLNITGAIGSAVKTGWNFGTAGIRSLFKFIGNTEMVGGKEMSYTDPYTGKVRKYIKTIWGTEEVAEDGANLKGCAPLPIKILNDASCVFCPLFKVLYDAANEMATLSFEKLGTPMASAMLVGFALFIAFKVLSHLSSLTKQDAPKFLGELLTQSFKVLLAFLFLTNAHQVYQYFIIPVLGAGLEFGAAMLFENPTAFASCTEGINIPNDTALLPVSLYAKLDCFIRAIQAEIAVSQAIGSSLMCVGRNAGTNKWGIWDFGMVFQGLVIWVFAIMLSLAFAFYLIDATVTLGLVGALMPFLIACWPFKMTTSYSKKGLEMFLNTFFVFVFMGIVVSINMQLIGQAMTNGKTTESVQSEGTATASTASSSGGGDVSTSGGGLNELSKALSGDDIKTLKKLTDIGFGGFLILLCCCIFGFKFTSQATTLADKMAGGGISGIGNKIGGMAAGGAAAVAKKATQPARQAVSNKANDLTSRAGAAIGGKLGIGKHGGKTGDHGGGKGGEKNKTAENEDKKKGNENNNNDKNKDNNNEERNNRREHPNDNRDITENLEQNRQNQ